MKSFLKIFSKSSDRTSVKLTSPELQFLIDCMWGHSRHDTQALAFRHNISDVELEQRLQSAINKLSQ